MIKEEVLSNLVVEKRNGKKVPFDGAEGLTFDRMWTDSSKDFLMDSSKNQGFPSQVQSPAWTSARLESSDRSATGPYMFYLENLSLI